MTAAAGNPKQLWFQKFEYEMSQEIGTPVANKVFKPSTSTKPLDTEKMKSIAQKYGIEFLD